MVTQSSGEIHGQSLLLCPREALSFPVVDGVPHLVSPRRQVNLRAFADEYSAVWRKDGWGGSDPDYLLALPYRDTTGREPGKWRVKARSAEALLSLVNRLAPRTVVDLGCGMGWLSYRLAQRSLEVYAVDAVLDDILGLDAAAIYLQAGVSFQRVWGEISRPPFRSSSLDLVICNASLHYVPSLADALTEIARVLRPGGSLVVMNSPVHEDVASVRKAEAGFRAHLRELGASESVASSYHHFLRGELLSDLETIVGVASEVPFDPGLGFRLVRRVKGLALRMELARFPILWARKRDDSA